MVPALCEVNLGSSLEGSGVHVAHVAIGVWTGDTAPEGFSSMPADEIAARYLELHRNQDPRELMITG